MSGTDIFIALLVLVGLACILWKNKRKFDRGNSHGIEHFPKFGKKLGSQLLDVLLQGAGYGCLLGGAFVWVSEYAAAWGWAIVLLFIAFVIEKAHSQQK